MTVACVKKRLTSMQSGCLDSNVRFPGGAGVYLMRRCVRRDSLVFPFPGQFPSIPPDICLKSAATVSLFFTAPPRRMMTMRCGAYRAPVPSPDDLIPFTKTLYTREGQAVVIVAKHDDDGEYVFVKASYFMLLESGCLLVPGWISSLLFIFDVRACGSQ